MPIFSAKIVKILKVKVLFANIIEIFYKPHPKRCALFLAEVYV